MLHLYTIVMTWKHISHTFDATKGYANSKTLNFAMHEQNSSININYILLRIGLYFMHVGFMRHTNVNSKISSFQKIMFVFTWFAFGNMIHNFLSDITIYSYLKLWIMFEGISLVDFPSQFHLYLSVFPKHINPSM